MEESSSATKCQKERQVLTQVNPEGSLKLEPFFQRHRQTFLGKRTIENCVIKAKVISVWPPYGLALPLDNNFLEVGVIFFHECRIVHCLGSTNSSSYINIRSKNISKHGVYRSKKRWPKLFQVGNDILVRISLPLKDCSSRWRKQCARNANSNSDLKLSDLIQYKAVKVWNVSDKESSDNNYRNEPALTRKGSNFDQMSQLYRQMRFNRTFCLEQLLGASTRQYLDDLVNCDIEKGKILLDKTPEIENVKTTEEEFNNQRIMTPCNKFNCKMRFKGCSCNCDNIMFLELEPIADNDNIYDGKDGIINIEQLMFDSS